MAPTRLLRFKWCVNTCILLLFIQCTSQKTTMSQHKTPVSWITVDTLMYQKPQDALRLINTLEQQARSENDTPALLRCLMYRYQTNRTFMEEDSAFEKMQQEVMQEMNGLRAPATQVLAAFYAQKLQTYFSSHSYTIQQRTALEDDKSTDFRMWDARRFRKEIEHYVQQSLSMPEKLQQARAEEWQDVLDTCASTRLFRPTLFDVLNHNAISYYTRYQRNRADSPFRLHDYRAFDPLEEFIGIHFPTNDSLDADYKILCIYQNLCRFHRFDNDKTALLDLERLRFLFAKTITEGDKTEEYYLNKLNILKEQYKGYEGSTMVIYNMVQVLHQKGSLYNEEVVALCNEAIQRFPESTGAVLCKSVYQEITHKLLHITALENVSPGKPFPILLNYSNVDTVYIKVCAVDIGACTRMEKEDLKNYFSTLKPVWQTRQILVKRRMYASHSAELIIDALPEGGYALMVSSNPDFEEAEVLNSTFVNSTVLGLIKTGNNEYRVLDNETGKNKGGVSYKLTKSSYDYSSQSYTTTLLKEGKTNADGIIKTDYDANHGVSLELTDGKSRLEVQLHSYYTPPDDGEENSTVITHFFTDRSLYRPGQTVYFKGIVLEETDDNQKKVKKNFKTKVVLHDVNGTERETLSVTTNEFGSYAGSFMLPAGLLNGQMYLEDKTTSQMAYFSVEEYKRPKFEVKMDPLTKAVQLNDSVVVSGHAVAYAGNAIDGATVKYTVKREYMKYWYRYSADTKIILTGETTTDATGRFLIPFQASGTGYDVLEVNDLFRFVIHTDVTDVNGETHTGESRFWIGQKRLIANVSVDDVVTNETPLVITPSVTNLNGEAVEKAATLTVRRIIPNAQLYKERIWQSPDTFLYTRDEWHKRLPHNKWMQDDDETNWKEGEVVYKRTLNEKEIKALEVDLNGWASGRYKVSIEVTDDDGTTFTNQKKFDVYFTPLHTLPVPSALFGLVCGKGKTEPTFEPGETAQVVLGSSYPNAVIRYRIVTPKGEFEIKEREVNNETFTVSVPVLEAYRGGVWVEYMLYYDHYFYSGSLRINVPFTNKELKVELQHWNKKMEPGSKEQWTVKISGNKKEKVAAEMLAFMYDGSLDAIKPHSLSSWWWNDFYTSFVYSGYGIETGYEKTLKDTYYERPEVPPFRYEELWEPRSSSAVYYSLDLYDGGDRQSNVEGAHYVQAVVAKSAPVRQGEVGTHVRATNANEPNSNEMPPVPPRSNFKETAFFYPQLRTDANGDISISFTLPESLTSWKFMAFAHTLALQSGSTMVTALTQKNLMVVPNVPRFLRANDEIVFSTKITNLTDKALTGKATLTFNDALTGKPLSNIISSAPVIGFTTPPAQSTSATWKLKIPEGVEAITYTISAKAGNFSDGEENTLPVLSDKILVTESAPVSVRSGQKKQYEIKSLTQNQSSTQKPYKLTLEFTSNPVWYAVQALPYLMEYPYECAEQTFNRYYSNMLSMHIAESDPAIKRVFDAWKLAAAQNGTASLLSNLEKNQELKQVLLEETPYVLQGKTESEQRQRMAALFDEITIRDNAATALRKLEEMEFPDGGWGWFKGMPSDDYITTYIATGFGRLLKLKVGFDVTFINRTIDLLDRNMLKRYTEYLKTKDKYTFHPNELQYIYMRSFYPDKPLTPEQKTAHNAFIAEAKKQWVSWDKMRQAMFAVALFRNGDEAYAKNILESLKQTALTTDEMGMYWKELNGGYYWYESPIETQSVILEAFTEIEKNDETLSALKQWLLKNKQTNNWKTTKATADACYALLLQGGNPYKTTAKVDIMLGNMPVNEQTVPDLKKEAGSGYFKTAWNGDAIKKDMGNLTVTMPAGGNQVAWGALYYQYFEQMDKVTQFANTPLQIARKLYLETNTNNETTLREINDTTALHCGDKIVVRLEIRCDRPMEYLHLKDMRGSGLEPMQTLSGYEWKGGLGYYQSTKDASTNFFIGFMPRGNYVLEYKLRVNNAGSFSNGITTLQCMYAPEFVTHSQGIRLNVKE